MKLLDYIREFEKGEPRSAEMDRLAKAAGTSSGYLIQLAYGHRRAGAEMAIAIEKASDGNVERGDLRPDLWEVDA